MKSIEYQLFLKKKSFNVVGSIVNKKKKNPK